MGNPHLYKPDPFDENGKFIEDPYCLLGGLDYNKAMYHCQRQGYHALRLSNETTGEEHYFKAIYFEDGMIHYLRLNFMDFLNHINGRNL